VLSTQQFPRGPAQKLKDCWPRHSGIRAPENLPRRLCPAGYLEYRRRLSTVDQNPDILEANTDISVVGIEMFVHSIRISSRCYPVQIFMQPIQVYSTADNSRTCSATTHIMTALIAYSDILRYFSAPGCL